MPDNATSSPTLLRAGPLTLAFDRGELRWFRLGEREVLRAIYVAVRPPDWSTVPAVLENLRVESEADTFEIRFDAVHRADPVWLEWKGRVGGTPDGRIRFEMDGVARSTFQRNRIGLCVLHPMAECADAACTVETTDGATTAGTFPSLVSPHQPFLDLRAVRHEVSPGLDAEVRFEGEVFEMEDQRNWSDASFKTYSTPLALPLPVEVREGERIRQAVTLTLHGTVDGTSRSLSHGWLAEDAVRVAVGRAGSWPAPRVGHVLGAADPTPKTIDRIRTLAPAHLRVDLRPSETGWRESLAAAARVARACRTGLEVAALVSSETADDELDRLADAVRSVDAPLDAWLVFDAETRTTTPPLGAAARERLLAEGAASAPILGGGTDGFFAELNRERTAAEGLDLLCLPLTPQVHAFDDVTMIENTTNLGWIAETIRSFARPGDTPLALSPVTLLPRPATDPRQRTLFAAGWTLGLLAAATEAGFGRVTLFELEGPGGVMDDGGLFPVGHVLAELAALVGSDPDARVIRARPSDPWRCLTLALQAGRLLRVYVFNPTPRPQDVVVSGLPAEAWQRTLRAAPGGGAGLPPGETTGQKVTGADSAFALHLDGHEIVALDSEVEA